MEHSIPKHVLSTLINAASEINWDHIGIRIPRKKMTIEEVKELANSLYKKFDDRIISTLYLQFVVRKELNGIKVLDPAMPYTVEDIAEAKRTRGLGGTSAKTIRSHVKALRFGEMYMTATKRKFSVGGQAAFYSGSDVRLYVIGEVRAVGMSKTKKDAISKLLDEKPHIQTNKELKEEMLKSEAERMMKLFEDNKKNGKK